MLTQLQTLYTDYNTAVQEVRKKARAFDGIFGLGKDPRKDACHGQFYDAVGKWVEEFLATEPSQETMLEAALFLVEEPKQYDGRECYWFMFAAQGHIKPMIGPMSRENCLKVRESLETTYKKHERMPLQKELLKLLNKK